MNPCPNCNVGLELEEGVLTCPGCGTESQIDPSSGNLRFMKDGQLISAPEDQRLAYDNAKAAYPEIYEEHEKTHPPDSS